MNNINVINITNGGNGAWIHRENIFKFNYRPTPVISIILCQDFRRLGTEYESLHPRQIREMEHQDGSTALHYAVFNDQTEIVKILLEAGANPNIKNEQGHSAIEYARSEELKKILIRYSNKYEEMELRREAEERRKFSLEKRLKQHIVGQEDAITVISSAIRRKVYGWINESHPLVLLFLGSSGVGKTEIAKHIASYMHPGKTDGFIRLDMSEYQRHYEGAKLIGAPPGYLGHEKGGQLTSKLQKCPSAVVLFDEIEKAHPEVLTNLLQLFDEGRITDGQGNTVDCKDAIFVMTSNLACDEISAFVHFFRKKEKEINCRMLTASTDKNTPYSLKIPREFKEKVIYPILKKNFERDEFIGRINEIVYFLPFSKSEVQKLVKKELNYWNKTAKERHGIELLWDDKVESNLVDTYDVQYGVRSIKSEIDRKVVNKLAVVHEKGIIGKGKMVQLFVKGRNITLRVRNDENSDFVDVDDDELVL